MTAKDAAEPSPPEETATGLRQIEGYLLLTAAHTKGEERARRIADRLEWMTADQRRIFEQLYLQDHMEITQESLCRVTHRSAELRTEYERRYTRLRRRLVAGHLVALAVCLFVLF
ncbi:hypothetical protein ACIOHE_00900 [Streptomyces sp. NPDC087851]|uniref:hypothetical protein n=1 Tax=Streptomyces sp. NPDC087851 TaxID=3365810 RepID=UPI0037F58092